MYNIRNCIYDSNINYDQRLRSCKRKDKDMTVQKVKYFALQRILSKASQFGEVFVIHRI